MKNGCLIISAVLMIAILVSSCGEVATDKDLSNEGLSKEKDAPLEVTIGSQVWMTKNLDVSTFRNGDTIPEAKSNEEWEKAGENKQPAWCYYDNDPANGAKYGKLYNWYAVNDSRGLAPAGWHVPTDGEWAILSDYFGGDAAAGPKIKSKSGWEYDDYSNNKGGNESGFSGLPGGGRDYYGNFTTKGFNGDWWSASVGKENKAYYRDLSYEYGSIFRDVTDKAEGLSVRCLRD